MNTYGEVEVYLHASFILVLEGVGGQLHSLAAWPLDRRADEHQSWSGHCGEFSFRCRESNPYFLVIQLVA
jgi:hypothetical protein